MEGGASYVLSMWFRFKGNVTRVFWTSKIEEKGFLCQAGYFLRRVFYLLSGACRYLHSNNVYERMFVQIQTGLSDSKVIMRMINVRLYNVS